MDKIDRDILHQLSINSRISATELGRKLNLSRVSIQKRISRLQDTGVISRFTIDFGLYQENLQIDILLLVKLNAGDFRPFVAKLKNKDCVMRLDSLNGPFDFAIELRVPTLSYLDDFLINIRQYPEVVNTDCSIRLRRFI